MNFVNLLVINTGSKRGGGGGARAPLPQLVVIVSPSCVHLCPPSSSFVDVICYTAPEHGIRDLDLQIE